MMDIEYEKLSGEPTENGWYLARMKTWQLDKDWAIVYVDGNPGSLAMRVWQAGDERHWRPDQWEWIGRIRVTRLPHFVGRRFGPAG